MVANLRLVLCYTFAFIVVLGRSGRGDGESHATVKKHVKKVKVAPGMAVRKRKSGRARAPHQPPAEITTEETPATAVQKVRSHIAAMNAKGSVLGAHGNSSGKPRNQGRQHRSEPKHPAFPPPAVQPLSDINDDELEASVDNNSTHVSEEDMLMDLGGGTGATIGGTGNLELDQDLVRRMRYQDKAVMLLLLAMYFVVLGFSASFAYRQALNDSPVTFYADPRYHDMVCEGYDQDVFMDAFNQSPKDVQLHVTGFVPVAAGGLGSVEWHGGYYYDVFSFSLDLSPWVVRESLPDASSVEPSGDGLHLLDGVVARDMEDLRNFLACNRNDLSIVELRKEVSWKSWEELATNIKHKIRQGGFNGIISIHRTECDSVTIYKNTPWANFMHSRTTKVLCALSVLGWVLYIPYMWLRCSLMVVRARYKIDIPISNYWSLIADKLGADGFVEEPNALSPTVNLRMGAGVMGVVNGRFANGPVVSHAFQAPDQFHAYDIYDAADWHAGSPHTRT